jgi:hypothetical protein
LPQSPHLTPNNIAPLNKKYEPVRNKVTPVDLNKKKDSVILFVQPMMVTGSGVGVESNNK